MARKMPYRARFSDRLQRTISRIRGLRRRFRPLRPSLPERAEQAGGFARFHEPFFSLESVFIVNFMRCLR
jgi:hypothetical protein